MKHQKKQKTPVSILDMLGSALGSGVVQEDDRITISDIKNSLHEKGFAVMMFIFSLPLCIPWPAPPGTTTIASLPIVFLSFQMLMGSDSPWFPKFIDKRSIKRSSVAFIIEKTSPLLHKLEKLTKPRLLTVYRLLGHRIFAFASFICSCSIFLPIPLTNFLPAIGITLMSLAVIARDGLVIMIGLIVSIAGVALTVLVLILGSAFVGAIFGSGG